MKKFLKYIITIIIMTVLLFESVIMGIICQKKDVFDSSYQNVIVDKYRMLQETNDKKIIMVSGSSSAFGLDQNMLEEKTGYKVVNLGLHAGFGHLFYSELAKENINPGDIVLLGYEYDWIYSLDVMDQRLIMSGVDDNIDMYKHIPIEFLPDFVGYLFQYAQMKNEYIESSGIYSREAFDAVNGQMTMCRDYAMSDYFDMIDIYGRCDILLGNAEVTISEDCIEYLSSLKRYVEERGASIYFVAPPVLHESVVCSREDFLKLAEAEEETIGIPYISDPMLYMFPMDLMSNAVYHCNSEGERIRTGILIDDLRLCGAIDGENLTEIEKEEQGETFALVDMIPKRFLHKPKQINRVYRIDGDGSVMEYIEGKDYIIDYDRGTIRRTENSAIPNYSEHNIAWQSGKFMQVSDPENYNPEGNRKYQILIDYSYYVTENELESIDNQSGLLSENLRNKILNGESIDIALCGDSIGAGADTNGQGIFLNYLEETLEEYYGISVNTEQLSIDGGGRDILIERAQDIIDKHPDVLIIEFGLYDHCEAESTSEEKVNSYTSDIESMVTLFQENGIDVILVGFFQQNMTWDAENMDASILYNDALRDIAQRKNIYFADVYNTFEKVGNIKHLSRDVMADYIHHPTEWGHKLYLTSIIDVFNIDGGMKPVDLKYYIYVE